MAVDKSKVGDCVAPVRERGLKLLLVAPLRLLIVSRSRKGAWIEIEDIFKLGFVTISRSRKGAWIEISPKLRR